MKRISKTVYATNKDRALITITPDGRASVDVCGVTIDELDELATAAAAAAEELRAIAERKEVVRIVE